MRPLFLATAALACLAATSVHALDVRFYPGERVYSYELSASHGASSLVLHNIAVINDGAASVEVSEVTIELMSGDRALDRRVLGAPELARAAAGGAGMQQAGLLDPLAFQFGGAPAIGGNQVIIDHGNGEFSFYGHLKPGSVRVRVGDSVQRLQQIGTVGSSGNSTEPNLHFHVCNNADPLMCAGIPVQFEPLEFGLPDPPRQPQTGDLLRALRD